MNTPQEKLRTRLAARNRANKYAAEIYPVLAKIFTPLVGQKIINASDGQLAAKYRKLLPEFHDTVELSVYKHITDYSLAWTVKTCEFMPPNGCMYEEATVYIGNLRNGVLESMYEHPFEGRSDYTEEEVLEKREAYRAAKKIADEAMSALYPFGEWDH